MRLTQENKITFLALVFLATSFSSLWSQLGVTKIPSTESSYYYASNNFAQANLYLNLVDFYPSLRSNTTEASFYKISTDLRLNRPGSEKKLSAFMIDNPTSYLTETAYYDLASYYFLNGKYTYALKWFSKIKDTDVASAKRNEYYFNKAYTLFTIKRFKEANKLFQKIENVLKYQYDVSYYLGYIAYQLDDYDAAVENFNKITTQKGDTTVGYFQADMNFNLGRFEKAIALARKSLTNANENQTSELSKIIGESYFNLKDYRSALAYLEAYKGKKGKWSNTDFYQLGYTHYRLGEYENAIMQFNKIISGNDAVTQNAYYHLADCYLKTNKKTEALNAFKSASAFNFDLLITEDAFLNYARLSYEIGNAYENTSLLLSSFLEKFPKNNAAPEIEKLLIDSYVNSRNYDLALKILEKKIGSQYDGALQKLNYMKAIALFQNGAFEESIAFFERSLKKNIDPTIEANCLYWSALAKYEMNNFKEVISDLKFFNRHPFAQKVNGFETLNYHMAYAYFKLKNHEAARNSFEQYLKQSNPNPSYQRDAFLRMGDSDFVLGNYWPAMESYEKSIKLNKQKGMYALYQKALSYGFVDRNLKKIEALNRLIADYPKTSLLDDTYFEMALAYTREKNINQALVTYDFLINNFPESPYRSRAFLNKGLILYNSESLEESMEVLKKLILEYPNEEVVQQALKTAKEISIDLATVDVFASWVKQLKGVTIEENELEQASFRSAERLFNDNKKKAALKAFSSYLKEYPNGTNQLQAHFLCAELYFQDGKWGSAVEHYKKVIEQPTNEYSEQSLVRITQAIVNSELAISALPYWKNLEKIAQFDENKRYALFNLMQIYHNQEQFLEAIAYAQKVLLLNALAPKIKWDAYRVLARSALAIKDIKKASEAYAVLENAPDTSLAVEALYFNAKQKHLIYDYKVSNQLIEKIAKSFGNFPEWNAKSLLLMSQNFYQLDDAFQASFILESILANFKQFPEIIEQAQADLDNIKTIEAQNNSSIKVKEENEKN